MPKRGKRYKDAKAKLTVGDKLSPQDAIRVVKDLSFARFDETVEVATRLGVDPRQADQVVRGTVILPHGTGKDVRVLVIAQGEKEKEASEAGADYVGVEFLDRIKGGGWTSTWPWPPRISWVRSVPWVAFWVPGDSCRPPRPAP
jgi:large subunit ribosomal protein L1